MKFLAIQVIAFHWITFITTTHSTELQRYGLQIKSGVNRNLTA